MLAIGQRREIHFHHRSCSLLRSIRHAQRCTPSSRENEHHEGSARIAPVIAALPKPIVHYKGFYQGCSSKEQVSLPAQLVIDDEGHERAEIERLAKALIDAICDVKPATIVWDGDAFA